jgi:hypothetical protein
MRDDDRDDAMRALALHVQKKCYLFPIVLAQARLLL